MRLRIEDDTDLDFTGHVLAVDATVAQAMAHRDVPFERIVEDLAALTAVGLRTTRLGRFDADVPDAAPNDLVGLRTLPQRRVARGRPVGICIEPHAIAPRS